MKAGRCRGRACSVAGIARSKHCDHVRTTPRNGAELESNTDTAERRHRPAAGTSADFAITAPHRAGGHAESLAEQSRECAAVLEAARQCDLGDRQRTRAQQAPRALEPHAHQKRMRRFLVRGAERADEMPRRIARHARQRFVVDVEMTVRREIVAHALQAHEHLPALRERAARTTRDRRRELGLQRGNAFDERLGLVGPVAIVGARECDRAKADFVIGAMARRQQNRFRRRNLDDAFQRAPPCRGVAEHRHPDRVAAADRMNARLGLGHAELARQRDAVRIGGFELQPSAQRHPHRGRLARHAQNAAASSAEHGDETVALAVRWRLQREVEIGPVIEVMALEEHGDSRLEQLRCSRRRCRTGSGDSSEIALRSCGNSPETEVRCAMGRRAAPFREQSGRPEASRLLPLARNPERSVGNCGDAISIAALRPRKCSRRIP